MKLSFLLISLLFVFCFAAERTSFKASEIKASWKKVARASPNEVHRIVFAIKLKEGASDCPQLLDEVSNPTSPKYTKYLTLPQVNKKYTQIGNVKLVVEWLSQFVALSEIKVKGSYVELKTKISNLEEILQNEFYVFEHQQEKVSVVRTVSFSLPKKIAETVDFVGYTTRMPNIKTNIVSFSGKPKQDGTVTPQLLNTYYNITSNKVTNAKSTQSLFESLGQSFSPADLTQFQRSFNLPKQAVAKVIGPNDPNSCNDNPDNCGEANLDVQYIMAIAQGSPTTYWSIDQNVDDIFLEWILAVVNDNSPPLVHSISYGSIAKEDNQQDMQRFNSEACLLGLRGVSIIVASGDDGVANFEARSDPSQCGISPSFPAVSPYITAVGATQGPESGTPEIACTSDNGGGITTGGGFSFAFSRPSYQDSVVQQYLSSAPELPPANVYNQNGRGYPDIALLGFNYVIVDGGQEVGVSGTSASTPVFAGLVTLINSARLNQNKKPVGFLNPALYQLFSTNPEIFTDITYGRNNCCAGDVGSAVCCQYGFNATVGWDPLTGLGSVNFQLLQKAFLQLP